jgi:pimeloyl-ACP methyl ester carboxylesterase
MNSTHLGPRCFPGNQTINVANWKSLSRFCWSFNPNGKLIIFVHGFGGDALATWSEFVSQWPRTHSGWDLAFFGYPSCRFKMNDFNLDGFNIDEHTNSFLAFMDKIVSSPSDTINDILKELLKSKPELRRCDSFDYSEIVLVAHSMGAVICRRALIQTSNSNWVSKSKLILFAPAHKGGKPLMLINALTGINWGGIFAATLNFMIPTLGDLRPEGRYLNTLETETSDIIKGGKDKPFIATHSTWAIPDHVVVNNFFSKDGAAHEIREKTHTQVCKPTPEWPLPLTKVLEHI